MVLTMASSPRGQREEERRLNLRTLAVASIASAVAAAITSQLWFAGTWVAAAVTPVLVSLLSEVLHRPTERIARVRTSDRAVIRDPAAPPPPRVTVPPRADPPPERPPRRPYPPAGEPDPAAPRPGAAGPVRVYRQPAGRAPKRRIAFGVVAATAAIAFVIGIMALTTTELIAGESISRSGNRTSIGIGGNAKKPSEPEQRERAPTDSRERPQEQREEERPSTETDEEEQQPPATETSPTPTVPEEQQAPTRTAPTVPESQTAPAP